MMTPKSNQADIAFLLEGSYPYIIGGVSAWTDKIIRAFPDYKIAIIFIGSRPEDYPKGLRYKMPDNVVHFEEHFIFSDDHQPYTHHYKQSSHNASDTFFHDLFLGDNCSDIIKSYSELDFTFDFDSSKTFQQLFSSKKNWDFIIGNYTKHCSELSFIDYFWTIKNIQKPLWRLLNIIPNFINVKAVHSVSTGYCGFLGALLHSRLKIPLVLTEHGIYTKERRIELLQGQVISDLDPTEVTYLRNLWVKFFELLSKICYEKADLILSLYSGARDKQIEEGARVHKTQIISNGIDIAKYSAPRKNYEQKSNTIGLFGRFVAIKDIKSFISSISIALKTIPDIKVLIAGPADEDQEYFTECQNLITVLNLQDRITFKTAVNDIVEEVYAKIDLMVLSSISEGMPLTILEAFAAGIPVVATNVGACSELIYGQSPEDQLLGKSGEIVNIADPEALAKAVVDLLGDKQKWSAAKQAAISRVEKYYNQELMFEKYADVYKKVINY